MVHSTSLLGLFLSIHLVCADNDTIIHGWVPEPDGRGTWSILWSSLATISLCTWSALHMSVPRYHDRWRLVLRRCKHFLIALVAPESILILSLQDYIRARSVVIDLQHYGGPQWTMVHAQFLVSDGFEIFDPKSSCDPFDEGETLRHLVRWGDVGPPPISSDELQSRSKSDLLVKLIAILQILYFASQTFFRALQHIRVTPLEVLVVAFVFCSLLSYAFNWSKPQDVEYSIVIEKRSSVRDAITEGKSKMIVKPNNISKSTALQIDEYRPEPPQEQTTQQPAIPQPIGSRQPESQSPTYCSPPQSCTLAPLPTPKPFSDMSEAERQSIAAYRPSQPRALEPLPTPKPFSAMSHAERESIASHVPPQPRALERLPSPGPYNPELNHPEKTSRLAKWLFAKGHEARGFYSICMLLSTIFGAIHCAGWNSPFPSSAEMVIWRVCAIMTTALATPCVWTIRFWLEFKDNRRARNVRKVRNVMVFLGGLYIVARVILIVLAFTTLRALPAETYETVEWTRYLPNFSS